MTGEDVIEKAHMVEHIIDAIKLSGNMSDDFRHKLVDYHGTDFFSVSFNAAYFLMNV